MPSSAPSGPSTTCACPHPGCTGSITRAVGVLDLVFEAAELRADPGLTLLLATAEEGSPTEQALHRLRTRTTRDE